MRQLRNAPLLFLWWMLLLCAASLPLRAQTQQEPLTLADYRAELTAAIADLEAVPDDEAAAMLDLWQQRFAEIEEVELPNGETVSTRSLLADLDPYGELEQNSTDESLLQTPREIALARLRGAVAQIDASASDNTAARLAILDEILARPEFNSPMSLWDRFLQWLRNLLNQLLPDNQSAAGSGILALLIQALPWLFSILIVAAIIWLVSYWLQRLLRSFVTDARLVKLAGDEELPSTAAEARQQARTAAQSGLYRDAVRRLYLAALLQLAEHDLITYERSLTNREVLKRVPPDSPIRPHLEPVIATFDQVWYGVREPDRATFSAYEQEIDTLAAVAARTAAEGAKRGDG